MESPYLPVNIDSPETIIEWNSNIGVNSNLYSKFIKMTSIKMINYLKLLD